MAAVINERGAAVEVIPSSKPLGAEVRGVDLRNLTDASFAALQQALLDRLVIVVRGQPLTDAELIALGKRFGELEPPGIVITGKVDVHAPK